MLKNLLTIILLLAPFSPMAAETTVSFVSVAPLAADDEFELVSKKNHSKPFTIPTNFISPKMKASTRDLSLVRVKNAEKAELCKFSLPKDGKDFVVVVFPAAEAFEAFVLRSDKRAFKPGDIFIHNGSTHTIRGVLGTTEFKLEAASGTTVRAKPAKDDNAIKAELFYLKDEKEFPLSKTDWPIEANIRSYLFFFPGKHDHPDYRAIDEFVDPSR